MGSNTELADMVPPDSQGLGGGTTKLTFDAELFLCESPKISNVVFVLPEVKLLPVGFVLDTKSLSSLKTFSILSTVISNKIMITKYDSFDKYLYSICV